MYSVFRGQRPPRPAAACCIVVLALAAGCSSPDRSRDPRAVTPTYDRTSGSLTALAYDSNHNGTPDTWTDMNGARPVQTRIDRNEDGRLDRWEYYDDQGKLVKVGVSRNDDGKADAWVFAGPDGETRLIEISSAADEAKIDRWEHYEHGVLAAAEEDTDHDHAVDKWETYEGGVVKTVAFDENADGRPDRRLTYAAGELISIETEPDATGRFTRTVVVKPD